MIVIVDYGVGNLASVYNMLKRLGIKSTISSDASVIESASKLILPGVGSFDVGMRNLAQRGLIEVLGARVLTQGVPILGICLGMQLLSLSSEEGLLPGLGWINAHTRKFSASANEAPIRIPHMGWNSVAISDESCVLTRELPAEPRFYFVHSYHVVCSNKGDVLGITHYGHAFTSMVHRRNIYGAQFHPEKSHKFGMALLSNFAKYCGDSDASY